MSVPKPILFMDELVRAIFEGRKTVTRRVGQTWAGVQPGRRLWVRECFRLQGWLPNARRAEIAYRAGGVRTVSLGPEDKPLRDCSMHMRWRPSIHMPRWASRLALEVVSVEKDDTPWSISDEEARREGVACADAFEALWRQMHPEPGPRLADRLPEDRWLTTRTTPSRTASDA